MSEESEEKIYFATLKEGREDYFVEYRPPSQGVRFATLQLIYPKRADFALVAESMEREAVLWHNRYPIPVMVSAFDEVGDLVHLEGIRSESHLLAFARAEAGEFEFHWRLLKDEELPSHALKRDFLLEILSNVERKTQTQLRSEAKARARSIRLGWFIVFLWIAVAPAAFLVLEFLGPRWFAILIFIYGMSRATMKALKMLGKWKKSTSEIAKAEEERRMRHHHYHCERNPDGFLRLKVENFQREQREEILRESESHRPSKSDAADKPLQPIAREDARSD